MDSRRKVPIIAGVTLGALHFALVGIPFIQSRGGGEALGYLIFFVDFPLYVVTEFAFQRLALNSVAFNFFWFVVLGTAMYFLIGYSIGLLVNHVRRKNVTKTRH